MRTLLFDVSKPFIRRLLSDDCVTFFPGIQFSSSRWNLSLDRITLLEDLAATRELTAGCVDAWTQRILAHLPSSADAVFVEISGSVKRIAEAPKSETIVDFVRTPRVCCLVALPASQAAGLTIAGEPTRMVESRNRLAVEFVLQAVDGDPRYVTSMAWEDPRRKRYRVLLSPEARSPGKPREVKLSVAGESRLRLSLIPSADYGAVERAGGVGNESRTSQEAVTAGRNIDAIRGQGFGSYGYGEIVPRGQGNTPSATGQQQWQQFGEVWHLPDLSPIHLLKLNDDYRLPMLPTGFGGYDNIHWPSNVVRGQTSAFRRGVPFPRDDNNYLASGIPAFNLFWPNLSDPSVEFDDTQIAISGTVVKTALSTDENPLCHPFGHDYSFWIAPNCDSIDPTVPETNTLRLLGPTNFDLSGYFEGPSSPFFKTEDDLYGAIEAARQSGVNTVDGVLGVTLDEGLFPEAYRPKMGDHAVVYGRWIVNTTRPDFHTEIHPPLLVAVARNGVKEDGSEDPDRVDSTVIMRPLTLASYIDDDLPLAAYSPPDIPPYVGLPRPMRSVNGAVSARLSWSLLSNQLIPLTFKLRIRPGLAYPPWIDSSPNNFGWRMIYVVCPPTRRRHQGDVLLASFNFRCQRGVEVRVDDNGDDTVVVRVASNYKATSAPGSYRNTPYALNTDDYLYPIKLSDLDAETQQVSQDGLVQTIASDQNENLLFQQLQPKRGPLLQQLLDQDFNVMRVPKAAWPAIYAQPKDVVTDIDVSQLNGGILGNDEDDDSQFPLYGYISLRWKRA